MFNIIPSLIGHTHIPTLTSGTHPHAYTYMQNTPACSLFFGRTHPHTYSHQQVTLIYLLSLVGHTHIPTLTHRTNPHTYFHRQDTPIYLLSLIGHTYIPTPINRTRPHTYSHSQDTPTYPLSLVGHTVISTLTGRPHSNTLPLELHTNKLQQAYSHTAFIAKTLSQTYFYC